MKGMSFYEPFMSLFMAFKSLNMTELHIWMWIVKQKKLATMTKLYKTYIKFEYNIIHSTNVPCKSDGIFAINKKVGAVNLIFLMYNKLRDGRVPIKAS